MAVIPFLLNSAGTWFGIDSKSIRILEEIQKKFLQKILKVKTCPIPLMLWDLGQHMMENRIIKRKLLLLKHISSLDEKALAHKFYKEQRTRKLPSLVTESERILLDFGITLDDMEHFSKQGWKKLVNEVLDKKNTNDLHAQMKPYKKLDLNELSKEPFGIKPYLKNLEYENALTKFRLRAKTCKTIKTHFKSDQKYKKDLWQCWECSFLDTSHQCSHYEDLRNNFNLSDENEVVSFFRRVIDEREKKLVEDEDSCDV